MNKNARQTNRKNTSRNNNFKGNKFNKDGRRPQKTDTSTDKNLDGHHVVESGAPKPVKSKPVLDAKFRLYSDAKILTSFVVFPGHNLQTTITSLKYYAEKSHSVVVFVSNDEKKHLEAVKLPNVDIQTYTEEGEAHLHNNAFQITTSDIFIATNSNIVPRPQSIEILTTYLYRDNTIATVPVVYSSSLEIQPTNLRFPSLISKIKVLVLKSEQLRLTMLERGLSSYYRSHRVDASSSQIVVLNSKAFLHSQKFIGDAIESKFTFYRNIGKCGSVVFVPMARAIELHKPKNKQNFVVKLKYYISNIV